MCLARDSRNLVEAPRRRIAVTLVLTALGVFASAPAAALATSESCTRSLNDAVAGPKIDPPLALATTAQSAQRQVNFGTDREPKTVRSLTLTTEKSLPDSLTSAQLNFESLLSRTGDGIETAEFPDPTFTDPRISPDRKSITFSACLDPKDISAGKYVGTITIGGPAGLGAAAINLTLTAKDGSLFFFFLALSLLIAFALLLTKDAATAYTAAGDNANWGNALLVPLKDLRWWVATIVAMGTAFGVVYAAYDNDPSWGASGIAAGLALIASAFAAVGGHAIITSLSSK